MLGACAWVLPMRSRACTASASRMASSGLAWWVRHSAPPAMRPCSGINCLAQPAAFSLKKLIKGWQEGIPGMKVGGIRKLVISPEKGYGKMGSPPKIPADSTLIFEVVGQQLSVAATRTIVARIEERFGGRLPTPAEALAADPQVLRAAGLSARKGAPISYRNLKELLESRR